MIIKDLNLIYKTTAKLTGLPIYKVEHAIKEGQFRYIKDWFREPDKPAVLLPDFGRFELSLSALTRDLKYDLLPRLRINPSDDNKEKFRYLWKLRKKVLTYILDKRRKKRHD